MFNYYIPVQPSAHHLTHTHTQTSTHTQAHTHPHKHTHTSTHTHTQAHTRQSLAMSLRNPSSCVGERLCRTSERPRSVAIFLLSGRLYKWVRRRLMLLADSASLSLSCWNLYTHRESTTQQIHILAMWLSLEQILPFLQVQFPYYHNCNYEQTLSFDCQTVCTVYRGLDKRSSSFK